MPASRRIEIAPGRRLLASPDWGAQSVVFDARSGDFWVVSSAVRDTLVAASETPELAESQLLSLSPEIIENLSEHGIIRLSQTS